MLSSRQLSRFTFRVFTIVAKLKTLRQQVWNVSSAWNMSKMKEILDFDISRILHPTSIFFCNIIRKIKKQYPSSVSTNISFCCHYGIKINEDVLPNHQSFLRRGCEISLTWFLLKMWTRLLIKQTETIPRNYQQSVM